jgi:Flp pilus assembly protein TadD
LAYEQVGRFELAIQELETAVALSKSSPYAVSGLGHVYGRSGRRREAEEMYSQLQLQAKTDYVPTSYLAWIQVGLGETARALELLEKAYRERNQELPYLKVEPAWDPLRSEA